MDIQTVLSTIVAANPKATNAQIRAALKAFGFEQDDIDATVEKGTKRGFAAEFYDWLAESERSESEVEMYILNPENSDNVKNHLSHYKAIGELAAKIWNR